MMFGLRVHDNSIEKPEATERVPNEAKRRFFFFFFWSTSWFFRAHFRSIVRRKKNIKKSFYMAKPHSNHRNNES